MPRSSESVAALGAALSKAQAVLVNPEKSLSATIPMGRAGAGVGEGEVRTFRYASLASGLDIVRKTLSQYEIATVQTTAVDPAAGLVNLTTMLVHASGEWIASDWPVCSVSDLASPRRMGAALTYARRYGLFTLVGIAGEDDLDAPDLQDRPAPKSPSPANGVGNGFSSSNGSGASHFNETEPTPTGSAYAGRGRRRTHSGPAVILAPEQSVELRDRLLTELVALSSAEQATDWAGKSLPLKNTLTVADAQAIEQAFERKLIELNESAGIEIPEQGRGELPEQGETLGDPAKQSEARRSPEMAAEQTHLPFVSGADYPETQTDAPQQRPSGIDKSVLALSEPRRHRNKEHLRFVARQACLICGRTPSDPHHLRFAQQRALGRKVSDEFVVPLCRSHHRALHQVGNEQGWWQAAGIDALKVARQLWGQSRLIDQVECADAPVRPEPLGGAADPRPVNVLSVPATPPLQADPQTARPGRRQRSPRTASEMNKSSIQAPADGRLPSR